MKSQDDDDRDAGDDDNGKQDPVEAPSSPNTGLVARPPQYEGASIASSRPLLPGMSSMLGLPSVRAGSFFELHQPLGSASRRRGMRSSSSRVDRLPDRMLHFPLDGMRVQDQSRLFHHSRHDLESIYAARASASEEAMSSTLVPHFPLPMASLLHNRHHRHAAAAAMPGDYGGQQYPPPNVLEPQQPPNLLPRGPRSQINEVSTKKPPSDEIFRQGNGITYTDVDETEDTTQGGGNQSKASARKTPDSFEAFPVKLYRMLEESEKANLDEIICFFPHGHAFVIHQPRKFVSDIMPKYFSTSRMSSFQRQLNLYGFKRITEGSDMGGYYHPLFVKGRPDLCERIKRRQGNSYMSKSNRGEPDFWAMPPMLPDGVIPERIKRRQDNSYMSTSNHGEPDFYAMPPLLPGGVLLESIKRSQGSSYMSTSNHGEPDFYAMPPLLPTGALPERINRRQGNSYMSTSNHGEPDFYAMPPVVPEGVAPAMTGSVVRGLPFASLPPVVAPTPEALKRNSFMLQLNEAHLADLQRLQQARADLTSMQNQTDET